MLKYIISSIKKNKFISVIFIIQMIIAIIGLSQISYYIDYNDIYKKNVEALDVNPSKMYRTQYLGGFFQFDINNQFIKDIEKTLGEDSIGISMDMYLDLNEQIAGYNRDYVENLKISKTIFNMMDLTIVEGRGFEEEDFNKNAITPILISDEYKSVFKLGDKFKTTFSGDYIEEFNIIGFFDKNCKWISQDFIDADFKVLKDMFIAPYHYEKTNKHNANLFNNFYLFNNTNIDNTQFKKIIDNILSKNSMSMKIESLEEILEEKNIESQKSMISALIIGSVLILFTLFSIGMVSFYSFKYREAEIGILKMAGMKSKKIKLGIMLEWTLYMVSSLIISLITIYVQSANSKFIKDGIESVSSLAEVSYKDVLIIWVILFILVLVVIYSSTKKIIDKEIATLVKGVE